MPTWTETDMKNEIEKPLQAGRYLVEVKWTKDRVSSTNGHPFWAIRLDDVESGRTVCFDNLWFGDKPGIAFKKMSILGVQKSEAGAYTISSPEELRGLRCYITVAFEEFQGKSELKPSRTEGTFFGYEVVEEMEPVAAEDVPF